MNELDEMLSRLAGAPLDPRLTTMDEAVFAGLLERQVPNANRSLGIAALTALAIGVVSSTLPGTPASAAPSVTPFGAPPALAPSSLLLASK
jgi:hypothetical protein